MTIQEIRAIAIDWLESNRENGFFEGYPEDTMDLQALTDDELRYYLEEWILDDLRSQFADDETDMVEDIEDYLDSKVYAFKSVQDIIDQGKEEEVIYECEFEIEVQENGKLRLIDTQGANLGMIEDTEFENYREVLERLEGSYLEDYGFVGY